MLFVKEREIMLKNTAQLCQLSKSFCYNQTKSLNFQKILYNSSKMTNSKFSKFDNIETKNSSMVWHLTTSYQLAYFDWNTLYIIIFFNTSEYSINKASVS